MSDTDPSDKTEEATPERRRKARDEGQFPRSKDAGAVAASAAVLLCLLGMAPAIVSAMRIFTLHCFGAGEVVGLDIRRVGHELLITLSVVILPLGGAAALAGLVAGLIEAGWHPKPELALPKWERLEPFGKLKQLFSPQAAMANTVLSLARVLVVGWVAYSVLSDALPELTRLLRADLGAGVREVLKVAVRLSMWSILALTVLAAVDYGYNWFKHEKQIRMSRQELKDELHQQEGDPKVKARMRARAREMARRGLAKEVKSSDVIVTNPTHISVALRYRAKEGAPVVAAKGYDEVALYIRELAKEHGIPIIENKPLARALAKHVKAGRTIPVDMYAAVAEVLAMVYRLKQRGIRA